MKRIKLLLLTFIILTTFTEGNTQFYKRFSLEIGLNKSKFFNLSSIVPEDIDPNSSHIANTWKETSASTFNYSAALGFRIYRHHTLKLRHSRNEIGHYLSGTFMSNSFCTVGDSPLELHHYYNNITNSTLGILYEYALPIKSSTLLFALGYEWNNNNFDDPLIIFPGVFVDNTALHSSVGAMIPASSFIHVYSKAFVTRHFENKADAFLVGHSSKFLPLALGIEVGIRLDLYN